jgi:hypothetical protein
MRTVFAINDGGLVVGFGIDPNNAARSAKRDYQSIGDGPFNAKNRCGSVFGRH